MAGEDDSDEKSFEPTQKRLDDAAKKGDVPRSIEVNTFFLLGSMTLMILVLSGYATADIANSFRSFLGNVDRVPDDPKGLFVAARETLLIGLMALALPLACAFVGALAGGMIQTRPLWTTQPLMPQVSRISFKSGFQRIFGAEALAQFAKGLLKLSIVGGLVVYVLWAERDRFEAMPRMEIAAILPILRNLSVNLLAGVLSLVAVVAAADYFYQRFTWMKRNRMTKRELKDEYKETEGNPEIKAKLRQIRMSRVRRRMMAAVPSATVIITNPTHYAVALKFERGMAAPVCVAKGVDSLALRIRHVAGEHEVPIVENPPLARALHATVDIDDEIPVEHYEAVAQVIGYVLRLRRRAS